MICLLSYIKKSRVTPNNMHAIYNDHNSFRICSESKNTIKLGYMEKREKKNEKRREKRISKRKEICFELSKILVT